MLVEGGLRRLAEPTLPPRGWDDAVALASLTDTVHSVGLGPHLYPLRSPTSLPFTNGRVQFAGFTGQGDSRDEALASLGRQIHGRYQELKRKGVHALTADERADWDRLVDTLDVQQFELSQPHIERLLAKTTGVQDGRARFLLHAAEPREVVVSMDELPAAAIAALIPEQWVMVTIKRTPNGSEWLEIRCVEPPPNEDDVWDQYLASSDSGG